MPRSTSNVHKLYDTYIFIITNNIKYLQHLIKKSKYLQQTFIKWPHIDLVPMLAYSSVLKELLESVVIIYDA